MGRARPAMPRSIEKRATRCVVSRITIVVPSSVHKSQGQPMRAVRR